MNTICAEIMALMMNRDQIGNLILATTRFEFSMMQSKVIAGQATRFTIAFSASQYSFSNLFIHASPAHRNKTALRCMDLCLLLFPMLLQELLHVPARQERG